MAAETKATQLQLSNWVVVGCILAAYISPGKFPGWAGWLGAFGFAAIAALIYKNPILLSSKEVEFRKTPILLTTFASALALTVASVVTWSIDR